MMKKINIEIPKINNFIHTIYINYARKLYSNIFLFDITIPSLEIQKNNRELEIICKECILNTIRNNIPIGKILNAYIDETTEDEIIETVITDISNNNVENITKPLKNKKDENNEDIKKNQQMLNNKHKDVVEKIQVNKQNIEQQKVEENKILETTKIYEKNTKDENEKKMKDENENENEKNMKDEN